MIAMKPNRYFLAIACGCAAGAVACADVVGISGYENGDALDASTGDGALESAPDTSPDGEVLGDVSDGATAEDAAEGGTPDTASSDTGGVDTGKPDAGPDADTGTADTGVTDTGVMDSGPEDSGGVSPYRHTITIDGTNDFSPTSEKLATTTTSVDAYVTWDASALYVGYVGSDLGALASANT